MSKFIIKGGKKLAGEIQVAGSKNAVLPAMAACLLTDEPCRLTNVPMIDDMKVMAEIMRDLGAKVEIGDHEILIEAKELKHADLKPELVGKFRGSVLLVGPLLARMKKVSMPLPGGDKIGARSIDPHISAMKALGAEVKMGEVIEFAAPELTGTKIVLEESSVTGTENTIMAASLASGKTTIKMAAMEPHAQFLGQILNQMGAKVSGIGSPSLEIEGTKKLRGFNIAIIPDDNEAASFITLAAATQSHIKVTKLNPDNLEDFLLKLSKMKVQFRIGEDYVEVLEPREAYIATKIQGGLYPKMNSDFIPPIAVLATQASGVSIMNEWMYENRLAYAAELMKMGAHIEAMDSHNVEITGPTQLMGAKMTSYDLRMGMTLVIAALVAAGESEIENIEHIDRGYENLETRLTNIGAEIERV